MFDIYDSDLKGEIFFFFLGLQINHDQVTELCPLGTLVMNMLTIKMNEYNNNNNKNQSYIYLLSFLAKTG